MKKLVSLILAVLMIAALSTTAFATSATNIGNESTAINVIGKYNTPNTDVISVDIVWGAMQFTYTPATKGEWDPATHSYKTGTATTEKWEANGNTFKVTNHSNVEIIADIQIQGSDASVDGYYVNCDKAWTEPHIAAATENSAQDAAPSITATVTVSTVDASKINFANDTNLAMINVFIKKAS